MNREQEYLWYYTIGIFMLGIATTFLCGLWCSVIVVTLLLLPLVFLQSRAWQRIMMIGMFVMLGIVLADHQLQQNHYHPLDDQLGQNIVFEGIVWDEPDIRDYNTRLVIYSKELDTKFLIKVSLYDQYQYGDRLLLEGTLEHPENFVGDSGRYFDYQNFLLKDGIRYLINWPELTLLEHNQGRPLIGFLLDLKQSFINQIRTLLPEPHVSLLGGLLIGAKSAMGQELLDDFRDTGVIHIVVLSGFNITIVIAFVMAMLGWMGRTKSAVVGTVGVVCFAIMAGAGSTVVRASIMALLVIFARLTGNQAQALRMLTIAAVMMLLWNPMLLLYDPSFQLSCIATLGLIALSPSIESYLSWVPNPRWAELRTLVAATIATQIMVTPLLLWMMGTFPTYSLITNFLILATVPWVMLFGFIAGLVSIFSTTCAFIFVMITYALLEYELWIVHVFARLPGASFGVPPFDFGWVILAYVVYVVCACWVHATRTR